MLIFPFNTDVRFTLIPMVGGVKIEQSDMEELSVRIENKNRGVLFEPEWDITDKGIEIEIQREKIPFATSYTVIAEWRRPDGSFSDGYQDIQHSCNSIEFKKDCNIQCGNGVLMIEASQCYKGTPGKGVPAGGAPGQALVKKTNEDYDTEWKTLSSGTGTGDGDDGKTPVIGSITAESVAYGEQPSFSLTHTSNDGDGNPVYTGTIKIPKGKDGVDGNDGDDGTDGKTPVFEIGTVETLAAGSQATASVVENGVDAQGNPKYKVNFGIPKGANGTGDGGGTVSLAWEDIEGKPSWIGATKPTYTASEVGALPASHNTDAAAHNDIRLSIEGIAIQSGLSTSKRLPFAQLKLQSGSYSSSNGSFSTNSTYKSILLPCIGGGKFGIYINGVLKGKNRTIFYSNGLVLQSTIISSETIEVPIPASATHVAVNFSLDAGMTTVAAWDDSMLNNAVFVGDVDNPITEDIMFNNKTVSPLLESGGFIYGQGSAFLIVGASFATPNNGWFELACSQLGVTAINKAVGSTVVSNAATKLFNGTLYTEEEFEAIDVLVIMFTHNNEVAPPGLIKANLNSYTTGDLASSSQACWDYIIRKYRQLCYEAKDNPASKWHGTTHGKPCQIAICSHWHDGRPIFNKSVRRLCSIWGVTLIPFDENIGFSYKKPLENGTQPSLIYAENPENVTIDGVAYSTGWHPTEGQDSYIQKKMAKIFIKHIGE